MATADEIREQIREAEAVLAQRRTEMEQAATDIIAAQERQNLRRQLDAITTATVSATMTRDFNQRFRARIDEDLAGNALPGMRNQQRREPEHPTVLADSTLQIANCRDVVDVESRSGASKACRGSRTR